MALSIRPLRGRPPRQRIQLSQAFRAHLSASQLPGWQLAAMGGWRHYPDFSFRLRSKNFPAVSITVERFYRLADALKFPREDVFFSEPLEDALPATTRASEEVDQLRKQNDELKRQLATVNGASQIIETRADGETR